MSRHDDTTASNTDLDPTAFAAATDLLAQATVPQCRLEVVEGGETGIEHALEGHSSYVGSDPSNDVVLSDRTVSRFHCEVRLSRSGARILDTGSRNGTLVDGVPITDAWLRDGSLIKLGQTVLRFGRTPHTQRLALSTQPYFGTLVGRSVGMRHVFARLERAAQTDSTVLLEGETGTGKDEAAQSIHEASSRSDGPFVVVDCASLPAHLLESELFGHERGAFTGADRQRAGAFEAANGGTVFLDEIGELEPDLQPKLLRVLEKRTLRRLGGQPTISIDVRLIAATNRSLRAEVNQGRFRPDLYYRLAVLTLRIPPLRERPQDIPLLADHVLRALGADDARTAELLTDELLGRMQHGAWPGNVRQLRNYLEQHLLLPELGMPDAEPAQEPAMPWTDASLSYDEARRRVLELFEQRYASSLVERHGGNVSAAARSAGLSRVHLHRLLRRHGVRGDAEG